MSAKKWQPPVRIADALASTFARLGVEARLREHEIFRVWPEVVGDAVARHAEPVSLKQGRLVVHVTDSVWLHQLSMLRRRLLEALRTRLGSPVHEIALRIGEVAPRPVAPLPSTVPSPSRIPASRLAEIDMMLSPVGDEELRGAFRRLLLRHERLAR